VKAIEAGLLTDGSSYSPTPSQPSDGQWLVQLAFVPDHSGASVRELHPLPVSSTHIARGHEIEPEFRILRGRCQAFFRRWRQTPHIVWERRTVAAMSRRKSSHPALARKMRADTLTTGGSATLDLALEVFHVYGKGIDLLTCQSQQKVCAV